MEVYLASCGSVSCDKFDASNAQWFKITEVGKRSGGGWVQQDQCMLFFRLSVWFTIANRTFTVDGKPHSFKLPSTLARGGYLLRHEIIALHLANQPGGAEFYPSCIQINVGGNQSGAPSPNELVKLPGAYKDNDPGILVDAFSNAAYKFPGPPVSKLASKASNVVAGSNSDASSPSSSPVPSKSAGKTKTPAQPSPSVAPPKAKPRDCESTKRAVDDDSDDSTSSIPVPETPLDDSKPRRISRVMARIVKPHNH